MKFRTVGFRFSIFNFSHSFTKKIRNDAVRKKGMYFCTAAKAAERAIQAADGAQATVPK